MGIFNNIRETIGKGYNKIKHIGQKVVDTIKSVQGLLHDVRNINDMKKLEKTCVKICIETFNETPSKLIGVYTLDNHMSDMYNLVYDGNGHTILGIRGTDTLDDVKTDFKLMYNALDETQRYRSSHNIIKRLVEQGRRIVLTGFSLGGAIALRLMEQFTEHIEECMYSFQPCYYTL